MVNASFALLEEWAVGFKYSLRLVWTVLLPLRGPAQPCPTARLAASSCARTGRCSLYSSEEGKRAVLVGFPSALAWLRMGRGESVYIFIS